MNYYNEFDPSAAKWLRNLIKNGQIPNGVVDERSIVDVRPQDIKGYTQCHFFAGIGGWPLALMQAGWVDEREVWTGSCPCQPFSNAGAKAGFNDERHLWPHFQRLIEKCRPATVFGEQVASKIADDWIDLVQTDLENMDYAFAAISFPSASIGAPHIRDRTYWVADSNSNRCSKKVRRGTREAQVIQGVYRSEEFSPREPRGASGTVSEQPCEVNGLWGNADWLWCRDNKWRPVEPGSFPLAHGLPVSVESLSPELQRLASMAGLDEASFKRAKHSRVIQVKGYGNAINVEQARVFITTFTGE